MHLKKVNIKKEEKYVPQLQFVCEWFSLVGLLKLEKGIFFIYCPCWLKKCCIWSSWAKYQYRKLLFSLHLSSTLNKISYLKQKTCHYNEFTLMTKVLVWSITAYPVCSVVSSLMWVCLLAIRASSHSLVCRLCRVSLSQSSYLKKPIRHLFIFVCVTKQRGSVV